MEVNNSTAPLRLSVHDRPKMIEAMRSEEFDLVVIGGGITGAGVARDAVSRGMKVALVEAGDFASGTSSRSSKLIHGGIRYLENLEFHLVFEALSERALLFHIAPHLVHPLRFVLPLYKGGRVGMLKMGLGMWAYDALSMFEAPEPHERLSAVESCRRLPLLQPKDLLGAYAYSDAYMDDDRLTLETLRAAVCGGAKAANRLKAVAAGFDSRGEVHSITVRDEGSQATDSVAEREFQIRAKHVISTVGPWTDRVASDLLKDWKKILRPSKGVHLTFQRSRFQVDDAIVMAADNDRRIVFGIPRNEMYIIGTTDTDFSGDPADVAVTAEDVRYLLEVADHYFPGAKLTKEDIVAAYAGVRPLVDDGSATESKTSREHVILNDPRGITFVAGGKFTTYRRMALDAVESALDYFSAEDRVRFGRSQTEGPINPLATVEKLASVRHGAQKYSDLSRLPVQYVRLLIERHAAEAEKLLLFDPGPAFDSESRLWIMEAVHAINETMCDSLIDFFARRTPLFLAKMDNGIRFLPVISRTFQAELRWTDRKREEQETALKDYVAAQFSWRRDLENWPRK